MVRLCHLPHWRGHRFAPSPKLLHLKGAENLPRGDPKTVSTSLTPDSGRYWIKVGATSAAANYEFGRDYCFHSFAISRPLCCAEQPVVESRNVTPLDLLRGVLVEDNVG